MSIFVSFCQTEPTWQTRGWTKTFVAHMCEIEWMYLHEWGSKWPHISEKSSHPLKFLWAWRSFLQKERKNSRRPSNWRSHFWPRNCGWIILRTRGFSEYRAILRYHRCNTPYRATPFQWAWHSPKMVRYPSLLLSLTQSYLCDTSCCYISRDNCAMPYKTKREIPLRYYLSLEVSRDIERILASTGRIHHVMRPVSANLCRKTARNYHITWRPGAFKTSTFGITRYDNFWSNLQIES